MPDNSSNQIEEIERQRKKKEEALKAWKNVADLLYDAKLALTKIPNEYSDNDLFFGTDSPFTKCYDKAKEIAEVLVDGINEVDEGQAEGDLEPVTDEEPVEGEPYELPSESEDVDVTQGNDLDNLNFEEM